MYYKIYLTVILLIEVFTIIPAMEMPEERLRRPLYLLSSAEELQRRLKQNYFAHLSEKSDLIKHLADKIFTVKEIMAIVRGEINSYCDYMENPKINVLMNRYKRKIMLYEALLSNEKALEEVKKELRRYEPLERT